ncbi:hypothetical protein [Streptomyces sp. UNOB3_S3]|uniref:hypothetical protein n=1 Tax=Streptomyces sp. UNOB3_S3 TaxID=2871682 RepID=UPI001E528E38|nr:hypothetical protein [Streptomyces sp. UNOB3_S3]
MTDWLARIWKRIRKRARTASPGLPHVNDANGASAELVIDGSGLQKVITGYVLPGKEAVGKYAFSLPPDAADKAEVEFSPDGKRWPDAYWSTRAQQTSSGLRHQAGSKFGPNPVQDPYSDTCPVRRDG